MSESTPPPETKEETRRRLIIDTRGKLNETRLTLHRLWRLRDLDGVAIACERISDCHRFLEQLAEAAPEKASTDS